MRARAGHRDTKGIKRGYKSTATAIDQACSLNTAMSSRIRKAPLVGSGGLSEDRAPDATRMRWKRTEEDGATK